jgi:hypothetical protein
LAFALIGFHIADPGGFEVDTSSAFTFAGPMVDTSFAGATLATRLVIEFDTPIAAISLPFLIDGAGPLELDAYAGAFSPGATPVGNASVSGTVPPLPAVFPEGVIAFAGTEFSSVVLTDIDDPAFAIGALTVTLAASPSNVPEPAGPGLLIFGLIALGLLSRCRGI